jgi:hypothetical protein
MKYEAKGTVYECDGCGDRVLQEPGDERPQGFYGTLQPVYDTDDGPWEADKVTFFACRRSHLNKAMSNALDDVRGGFSK